MTVKERVSNLEENYCELRGYSYLLNLMHRDIHSGDFKLTNDSLVAMDALYSFIMQKIGDLDCDLGILLAELLKEC